MLESTLLRNPEPPLTYHYQVGGSLSTNAFTYVVRSADRQLYQALKLGQFCYILNARQMGKSSLRVKMMQKLQAEGFVCAAINLSEISHSHLTLEQWYASFIYLLSSSLNLLEQVDIRLWWHDHDFLSPIQRLSQFIKNVLLVKISEKIIIFIDEVDSIFNLDFEMDDFFNLLRDCFINRVFFPEYKRLNFVLLGVATPGQLMQDRTCSLFKIGQSIQLSDFKFNEVQFLLNRLSDKLSHPQTVLKEVLAWTSGQPFLTQKICELIDNFQASIPAQYEAEWVADLIHTKILYNWELQDEPEHLRTIRDRLIKSKYNPVNLLNLYQQILNQKEAIAVNSLEDRELLLSGLVVRQQKSLKVHNRIYKLVFNDNWINQTLEVLKN